MKDITNIKLLFIINPKSGSKKTDWPLHIQNYLANTGILHEIFELPQDFKPEQIRQKINHYQPQRVIAAGGDGTVKLVAEYLLNTGIPLGILPAGSANGLAEELGIPQDPEKAIAISVNASAHSVHLVKINNEICIHLCDIGFNAALIKEFDKGGTRGKWGYFKACCKVIFNPPAMRLTMVVDDKTIKIKAAMVVVANATRYGTGAVINPAGELTDSVFEVIALKKISVSEIFKMMVTHAAYDPEKTELFQVNSLEMYSRKRVHFQVDGEYLGKINTLKASIITGALSLVFPDNNSVSRKVIAAN